MVQKSATRAPRRASLRTPQAFHFRWPDLAGPRFWDTKPPCELRHPNSWLSNLAKHDARRLIRFAEQCHGQRSQITYRIELSGTETRWVGETLTLSGDGLEGTCWFSPANLDLGDQSLAHSLPCLLYLYDFPSGLLVDVNRYGQVASGRGIAEVEQLGPSAWEVLVHPDDASELPRHRRRIARLPEDRALPLTFRLALASGAYAVMNGRETVAAYTPDGKPWLVMGTAIDSSDTIYLQRELLRNVLHDATTQLPNRLLFQERLDIALRPRKSAGAHPPAVLLLDIDRFQMVNEGFGHDMGDQMLARMARRLEECIAEDDLLARFGGDEFAILMENRPQPADALTIAERIVQAVRAPFEIGGSMLHASVRIGIAVGGGDKRATELVHEAEVALSGAKRPHSTGVEVFERRMFSRAAGHLHLDAELRRALARGELRLLYQPICSLHDGAIRGFEALLRWKHPRRGLIAPGEFLENAGLTGFIVPIGYYVLEEACKQLAEWGAINPSVSLSVNVDGRQFSMPDLALRIASLIARHGADPNQLKLELTETVIMQHDEIVAGQLDALRQLGVGILLDDFGTGFSSLGRLRQLPIDTLKIDRSFVQGAESNDDDAEIVRTILGLARTLGMTTVAEGIESHGQAQLMESQGCDLGQGYYFHRPLPAEDATRLLMQRTV